MYYETLKEEIDHRESKLNQPDRATLNLTKYEAEIESMTSFYPILRSFIRYSRQSIDGEQLAAITVTKLKELAEI